jgi:hypothetical protein
MREEVKRVEENLEKVKRKKQTILTVALPSVC